MIVKPKTRGFICTTAHPVGCKKNVEKAVAQVTGEKQENSPRSVLVIGASTGYGLGGRVAAAFGYGAYTTGIFLERPASGNRTATPGWYQNKAFEELAGQKGLGYCSINGDAFSDAAKAEVIAAIKEKAPGGKVDLVLYSLAAPKRTDPQGKTWSSALKPVGETFRGKTVDFHSGKVSMVEIEPAAPEELEGTIKVMGGEDWLLWMQALDRAGVLEKGVVTLALSYIGPEQTHAIYKNGTIGKAKEHLEETAKEIDRLVGPGGKAFVSVNKALVTQASSAIPVVPLYISLLLKSMRARGTDEDCTGQMHRLLRERLYAPGVQGDWSRVLVDGAGRIRLDDLEMDPEVQQEIGALWDGIETDNIEALADLAGYREDFFRLFGFGIEGVDYDADVEI